MYYRKSKMEKLFDYGIYVFLIFAAVITLYPFLNVISLSFSSPEAVLAGDVTFYPNGFSLSSFEKVLRNPEVLRGYYNTIWYTVFGTFITVFVTLMSAYVLSKKTFPLRKFFTIMLIITMYFGGGLIPLYIWMREIGLYNTRAVIVLPTAVSAYFVIVAITFFNEKLGNLEEAAEIDGCGYFAIFLRIVIPVSKPIIAVIALFSAVLQWNSWFHALIFLEDKDLRPLQVYLVNILVRTSNQTGGVGATELEDIAFIKQFRYGIITLTVIPIVCVYPFLQKYFVKGMMIGSIKG